MNTFDLLMIVSLGTLAGTAIGLFIGRAARWQKSRWSLMTVREKTLNIALVLIFSGVCMAALAGYELL
jgi:hypothetical protein